MRAAHPTKSAQTRALAAAGWERAKIARHLGLRYQHVRNVLEDDKRRPAKAAAAAASGSASGADVPPAEAAPVDLDRALDALMRARRGPGRKQNISVSIEADIVAAAAALGLDLSAEVERALTALARQRAADLWLAESREAIEEHNRFVERHGLWSDGFRQF